MDKKEILISRTLAEFGLSNFLQEDTPLAHLVNHLAEKTTPFFIPDFLEAWQGNDLWPQFAIWLLTDVRQYANDATKPVIDDLIALYARGDGTALEFEALEDRAWKVYDTTTSVTAAAARAAARAAAARTAATWAEPAADAATWAGKTTEAEWYAIACKKLLEIAKHAH